MGIAEVCEGISSVFRLTLGWKMIALRRGEERERGQDARREPMSWVCGRAEDAVH